MKSADSTTAAGSGKIKLTAKANDERLQHVVSARKSKLGQLTRRMNQMVQLIDEGDDSNLQIVQTMLAVQFNKLFGEFCELNTTVKALLQQISEDEMNEDQDKWFEPRANTFMDFLERAKAWMKEVHLRMAESEKHNEEVEPSDSVSAASVTSRKQGSISSSSAHSKASSSASAARLKAELERVALLAKASALKQKQELDTQEAKAKQEAETILARLKLQREELEIQTALAASDAKFKVLDEFECLQVASRTPSPDGMNSYIETAKPFESQACKQLKITPHRSGSSVVREHVGDSIHSASSIASQPEQGTLGPTQAITEFLVRQQKLAALPPQNIPIFNGDPMDYRLFIRAFEHGVEDKTDSCRDRLYYMEQYTSGQPRELIRSCLHMEPKRGYCEAKKLLQEHFGNEYTISRAYIEKALNWPGIKSDDGAALQSFGLYLTGCRNAMADVAYMEELDNAVNMRSIISKLPYKMRERWRAIACGIFDKQQRRVKFSDLVDFVNKQAREASHPVFGSIMDGPKSQAKVYPRETSLRKSSLGRVCTTATTAVTNLVEEKPAKMSLVCAFSKPCLFCQGEQHTMEHCKKMKRSLHKEKIDFLRSKVLHMKTKVVSTEVEHKGVPSDNGEGQSVVSGCIRAKTSTCGATTWDNVDSILAIVPIKQEKRTSLDKRMWISGHILVKYTFQEFKQE
ncbi:hypothetical protein MHYP_G00015370 [Metynnis hypsauchen]